jgi:hypothetical protein
MGVTLYKRGGKWWYEFEFRGQRVRETSNSGNKSVAERIMRERRRLLELNTEGLQEGAKPKLFAAAAKSYLLDREPHWSKKTPKFTRTPLPIWSLVSLRCSCRTFAQPI